MQQPQPLVAGNWKMNGTAAASKEAEKLAALIASASGLEAQVMLCPPATLIGRIANQLVGSVIQLGGQDCHSSPSGAHTGDISAEMLADTGATAVIVGHSERRTDHNETSEQVKAKAEAAHRASLIAIVCIGETDTERQNGETLKIISDQLNRSLPENATANNTVIAYEPVWAIGTGLTPTPNDVAEVHSHIRQELSASLGSDAASKIQILYGGSVKPANAAELMSVDNVNGALVGGASLKAEDFWGIIKVYIAS